MTRALVLALLLCGCGSDDDGQDLSGVAGDLASASDQAVNLDMLPPRTFRVNLLASTSSFLQTVPYGPSCARLFDGPCEVVVCPAGTASGWVGGEARTQAGVITASSGTASISIAPGAGGNYGAPTGGPLSLDPGTPVSIVAAGGDVPMFSAMLTAPGTSTIVQGLPAAMPRAADATFTFSPIADADVLISFSQPATTVICFFPGAGGQGTVPATTLGQLLAQSTQYGVYTVHRQELTAGSFGVGLRVARTMTMSSVTLQ